MFADEIRHTPAAPADVRPFRVLTVTADARVQRALDVLWREHEIIACADAARAVALATSHDIDAVLCAQRIGEAHGSELLQELSAAQPRALRMLLADRLDARVLLDAVNEVEVFRLIDQPWNIEAMREAATSGLRAVRLAPPLTGRALADEEFERVRKLIAVVVIESDAANQQRLRDLLQGHYKTHFAISVERALQYMEQHETGVLLCSTATGRGELFAALKALKQAHPHLAAIALDALTDLDRVLELVNQARIFRLLRRAFNPALCRPYVDAALTRYWQIKQQPQLAWRVLPPDAAASQVGAPPLPQALLNRIRGLPGRLHESESGS